MRPSSYVRSGFFGHGDLAQTLADVVVDRHGALFDEMPKLLRMELRDVRPYAAILEAISDGRVTTNEIAPAVGERPSQLHPYINTLAGMRVIQDGVAPLTKGRKRSAGGQVRITDPFVAFWYRFVSPYQERLEDELDPNEHVKGLVLPNLANHCAPVFEAVCRSWTRRTQGLHAQRVGQWWGPTPHDIRKEHPERESEEIDIVGTKGTTASVALIGECRWRSEPMGTDMIDAIDTFKIPALRSAGFRTTETAQIFLFSRDGFTSGLEAQAAADSRIHLVTLEELEHGVVDERAPHA